MPRQAGAPGGWLPRGFPSPTAGANIPAGVQCIALPGYIDLAPQLHSATGNWSKYGLSSLMLGGSRQGQSGKGAQSGRLRLFAPPLSIHGQGQASADIALYAAQGYTHLLAGANDLANPGQMLLGLHQARQFDLCVLAQPELTQLAPHAHMHLCPLAMQLGVTGHPPLAEHLAIHTLCELALASGVRIHLCGLSSARSLVIVAQARHEGLPVSADVPISNLLYTCNEVGLFNTAYKLWPPLRDEVDRQALVDGLASGVIDAISSGHRPNDHSSVNLPFLEADFNHPQWPGLLTHLHQLHRIGLSWEVLGRAIHTNPARILGIHAPTSMLVALTDHGQARLLHLCNAKHSLYSA